MLLQKADSKSHWHLAKKHWTIDSMTEFMQLRCSAHKSTGPMSHQEKAGLKIYHLGCFLQMIYWIISAELEGASCTHKGFPGLMVQHMNKGACSLCSTSIVLRRISEAGSQFFSLMFSCYFDQIQDRKLLSFLVPRSSILAFLILDFTPPLSPPHLT